MAPGFEALHFGFWLQEVIWDRRDGFTIPTEARSFLPGEATIFRDPCRRFIGYQIGNHYRDARYALLTVNNPHIDPIFGESRNEYCREEWWRARQSEENADKTERKAAGMQMGLGVPQGATFQDERGNPIFPREMAENLVNAAVRGDCFTYPLTAFSKQDCLRNPALLDIPAVKVTQYDWGNNGPALAAHLSRISAIDTKIMMARMRPSREAMEGRSGTRAEAGVHGQIGVTDSELVAAQQLSQITAQVLDRWAVTNFGPKAAGMLVAKQAPLSDPQQQFLQDVYKALCSGQKPDPETVAQIDRRALGKRVEMPLLDEKTVQATLAQQQPSPSASISPPVPGNPQLVTQSQGLSADDPTKLMLADELTGGHWVTINGVHVYIKDRVVVAGPPRLLGEKQALPQQAGEAATTAAPENRYEVCFAAGTLVVTKSGEKPIENIAADESVMAVSDTDPLGEPRPCRVLGVFHNRPARIWHVTVTDAILRTTANHLFFAKDKGWVAVATLTQGDRLRTIQRQWVKVDEVVDSGVSESVFNLKVEGAKTYFVRPYAGSVPVLVHNDSETPPLVKKEGLPISPAEEKAFVQKLTEKARLDAQLKSAKFVGIANVKLKRYIYTDPKGDEHLRTEKHADSMEISGVVTTGKGSLVSDGGYKEANGIVDKYAQENGVAAPDLGGGNKRVKLQDGTVLELSRNGGSATLKITRENEQPVILHYYNDPVDLRMVGRPPAEAASIREYVQRSNEWLINNGPQTIKSTKGALRDKASAAANKEKDDAVRRGKPYKGQPGHVPDTAVTGDPNPPGGWLDMAGNSNQVAGGALGPRVGQTIDIFTVDGVVP